MATEMQEPQQSTRIAEKIEKLADMEVLQNPNNVEPCRSRRLEELKNKKKDAQDDKFNLTTHHHRPQRNVEVQTLNQELVLACIQMYVKVTERPVSPKTLAQQKFPMEVLNAILKKDTGELMEMRHLLQNPKYSELWGESYTKELGRLAQGVLDTNGTDNIMFIKYSDIPLDRQRHVMFGKTVVTYRPEKCWNSG